MTRGPTVDVVIVTYNSRDHLPQCLEACRKLGDLGNIVVVEHGDDGSAAIARTSGCVVIEQPENPGFGAGQNRGFAEGSSPAVLICNPDAVVDPCGIESGLKLLASQPDVGAVGGVVTDQATGRPERSHGGELGPLHLWGRLLRLRALARLAPVRALAKQMPSMRDYVDRVPSTQIDVELLAASILLVRRTAFEQVGGFDEDYFLYGEDLDLCRRLHLAGWRLVSLPDGFGSHSAGSSLPRRWEHELQWWRGTLQYEARWSPASKWPWIMAAGLAMVAKLSASRPRSAGRAWQAIVGSAHRTRLEQRNPAGEAR